MLFYFHLLIALSASSREEYWFDALNKSDWNMISFLIPS